MLRRNDEVEVSECQQNLIMRRFHKCKFAQSVSDVFLDSCFRRNDELSVRRNDDLSVRGNDDLSVRGNDDLSVRGNDNVKTSPRSLPPRPEGEGT